MKIAIIGGGAAGFFSAINIKYNFPDFKVVIFEKNSKVLSKVKISGGGRCNVTNNTTSITELCKAYPRGGNKLKKMFSVFSPQDTMKWFENLDVKLITQEDKSVFPETQNSQTIIDCFLNETKKLNIEIKTEHGVKSIIPQNDKLTIEFINSEFENQIFDKVIVTTGGSKKRETIEWLEKIGHRIEAPVPSLFSFNIPENKITELSGIVFKNAMVSLTGTKIKSSGALLITHWGMSGPAILKLSSLGARVLSELNYNFTLSVNWAKIINNEIVIEQIENIIRESPKKILQNIKPFDIQERLWFFLLEKAELPLTKKWNELGKKGLNKITSVLTNDEYQIKGQPRFKEEFVTCGGISLESVDLNTMQSKVCKNLYFAGEILDIDGITGGFNFQNAWTTAYIAAKLL